MKHSLWRLISSFYILLISGLMVIISAYAWMVISKAPGVSGSSVNVNLPKVFYDTVTKDNLTSDGLSNIPCIPQDDGSFEYWISSAEDFVTVMRAIDEGKISGDVSLRLRTHISLEDTAVWNASDWKAVSLKSSLAKLTIYADETLLSKTETQTVYLLGLTDSLFSSAENAGNTSIELRNITLLESSVNGENGAAGAFIANANMSSVSVWNCHLVDGTISGGQVGGIAGSVTAGQVLLKNCSVSGSSLNGSTAVGGIVGALNGGKTVIADPVFEKNELFRSDVKISEKILYDGNSLMASTSTAVLNFVNTELATVEAYRGFAQAAADCFDENTFWQTWSVHGEVKMENEIRFRGNHVDIVGKENAVIELSGNSVASEMGHTDSPAGFNFGELGVNTQTFQASSSVKFADITFKNIKETNENTNDIAYYMYANARSVSYSSCSFDRGVLVFGSAYFSNCKITDGSRYCVNFIGSNEDSLISISNSEFKATEKAQGCVLADGKKQLFAIYNSDFYNETELPAVYLNGSMSVLTDGENYFDSPYGGILAETKDSCSFNGADFYCPTKDEYLNADIVDKAHWDRTEHGNNAAVMNPDAGILYDSVDAEIPSEIAPDPTDTETYYIYTAEQFIAVMKMLNAKDESGVSTLSGNYKIVLRTHVNFENYLTEGNVWESVNINDANKTLQTITIEADTDYLGTSTAFIRGLNKPLFGTLSSAESKSAGLVLENLTIIGSEMELDTNVYNNAGAFISKADFKKGSVFIRNCHSLNNVIVSTIADDENAYSRIGGIVGYTIMSSVWMEDCTVRGCTLTGASVGGIIGHSSASQSNETYIVNCFVENTTMTCIEKNADWRVGEIIGTANGGGTIVLNPVVLENRLVQEGVTDSHLENDPYKSLYGRFKLAGNNGRLIFVDTQTNPDLHTALVYGGFDQNATQFMTSDKQTWLIYGSVRLKEEIRFMGNDITLTPYGENAELILNSISTNSYRKSASPSPSGFNFGEIGVYRDSFMPGSTIQFENLTIKNQKTYKTESVSRNDARSYTYAFAENVYYTNCTFEDGVVVYGNAVFDTCVFTTVRANDLCLILDNDGYDCEIKNCTFEAKDDAKSCVVSKGTKALTIQNSVFKNQTVLPAVILNGQTAVITDQNNIFYSQHGGILAAASGSSFNGNACVTTEEYENADQLTKANYDKTEHGNNGGLLIEYRKPSAEIPDVSQINKNEDGAYLIDTPEQFIAVMDMLNEKDESGVSTLSGDYKIILRTHIDFTGYLTDENVWQSVSLNIKNQSLKSLTIEADTEYLGTSTAFIKGLNAPLFDYAEASSGAISVVLKDITIIDSTMNLTTKETITSADSKYANAGIFMSSALLTKGSVSFINCHAINSTIACEANSKGEYARVGGIVGYTNSAEVLIQDCSVRGCSLTGASTGGIVGHASATKGRKTNIVNCFAENTTVCCVEANATWRVGEIVGTVNQGIVTVENPMVSGNQLVQEGVDPGYTENDQYQTLYGRFRPSGTGQLIFINAQDERYEVSA